MKTTFWNGQLFEELYMSQHNNIKLQVTPKDDYFRCTLKSVDKSQTNGLSVGVNAIVVDTHQQRTRLIAMNQAIEWNDEKLLDPSLELVQAVIDHSIMTQ